jgi:hypothetical protein
MPRRSLLALSFLLALAPDSAAQAVHATTLGSTTPLAWSAPNPDGSRVAILEGDRSRPGTRYAYLVALPAGFDGHVCHDVSAELTVITGELLARDASSGSLPLARLATDGRMTLPAGHVLGLSTPRPAVIRIVTVVPFPWRREPGAPDSPATHEDRC